MLADRARGRKRQGRWAGIDERGVGAGIRQQAIGSVIHRKPPPLPAAHSRLERAAAPHLVSSPRRIGTGVLIQRLADVRSRLHQSQDRLHDRYPYGHAITITGAHELDILASGNCRSLVPVLLYEQVGGAKDVDIIYAL